MKKILALLLVIAMMLALVACTKTNNNEDENKNDGEDTEQTDVGENTDGESDGDDEATEFDYMTEDLTQYLTLGKYEGLEATIESSELTDEEYNDYLNSLLSQYEAKEQIKDRAVEEGDEVLVDFRGSMDGVDFAGGTAQKVVLVASDGNGYIPGFGSGIIGHTPGEEFDINVTFPDPYENNPDFSGKEAVFHITLHCIYVGEERAMTIDDLTDDFVYSELGFESVDEFLAQERKTIEMQKPYSVQQNMYAQLWQQIIEDSEVIKYPDTLVEDGIAERMEVYEYYASYYGMDLESLLEQAELTEEDIKEEVEAALKEDLVMYSLVKALDAEVTDSEVDDKIAFFADMYGVTSEDMLNQYPKEQFEMTAQFDKVMELVAKGCNITEAAE